MIVLVIVSAFIFIVSFIFYYLETVKEERIKKTAKESELCDRFLKDMQIMERYDVEEITIERTGVCVRSFFPEHTVFEYKFKRSGHNVRNKDLPRVLSFILRERFPFLGDGKYYRLSRYPIYRAENRIEHGYRFTLKPRVRDMVYKAIRMENRSV